MLPGSQFQARINGGQRGYLVGLAPDVLTRLLSARPVACASAE